jgi:pimeloyl-ACP methyl ester carboxylesterase
MKGVKKFKTITAAGIDFLHRPGNLDHTIVLLHGIAGRATSFAHVLHHWPEGPQILAWDCPGYGKSCAVVEAAPTPFSYAKVLVEALDELKIQNVDMMGQSVGALFAGSFATHFPGRLRRLVLMCPALGYQTRPSVMIPIALAKRIEDHETEGPVAFAASRASRLVHAGDGKPEVVKLIETTMASIGSAAHKQAVYALAQGDLIREAESWQKPVMIVAGADDIITPLSGTERLFSTLRTRARGPNVFEQMSIVGDSGHAVYLEHPKELAFFVASFFAIKA